jgi:NADP-dependent 3-hydroxy acid dehydrogenase YdfG
MNADGNGNGNGEAFSVAGRSVLVTGGTTGIGLAAAKLLAKGGAKVMIFGRHQKELSEALAQIGVNAQGITADASKPDDLRRVFKEVDHKLGGLDVLINNATISCDSVTESSPEDAQYVIQTNLVGYITCCHEAIPRLKKRGGGHIVNIGSMSADLREEEGEIYVATKAAIQAFSESLRKTANKDGIKITLIEPGAVDTCMQTQPPEEKQQRIRDLKMLTADDLAQCIYFCLHQPKRLDVVTMQVRPLMQLV